MDKNKSNIDTDKSIKQLEEENEFLRIENAYLKEIRRLNLESDAKMKMNSKRK
ncbi:transposase [Granulicatella balaenopterae]|uniref:Transposase n=1 Tax=Granulicatella balaenopterae TaxID=137733 RepID=A0A1H9ML86_9LACT|nr:transposase [Granulicatella balaenopterae]